MGKILSILRRILEKKPREYLQEEPWEVYRILVNEGVDRAKARLVLISLLADAMEKAREMEEDELSACLQRTCSLQKGAADELAALYRALHAPLLAPEPKRHDPGFQEFCSRVWAFRWDGSALWDNGDVCFDCFCSLRADIRVASRDLARDTAREVVTLSAGKPAGFYSIGRSQHWKRFPLGH